MYDINLRLQRGDLPFGTVRVGVYTVFLKDQLEPQFNHALTLAASRSSFRSCSLRHFRISLYALWKPLENASII